MAWTGIDLHILESKPKHIMYSPSSSIFLWIRHYTKKQSYVRDPHRKCGQQKKRTFFLRVVRFLAKNLLAKKPLQSYKTCPLKNFLFIFLNSQKIQSISHLFISLRGIEDAERNVSGRLKETIKRDIETPLNSSFSLLSSMKTYVMFISL